MRVLRHVSETNERKATGGQAQGVAANQKCERRDTDCVRAQHTGVRAAGGPKNNNKSREQTQDVAEQQVEQTRKQG
jgi:hypothetical protein